jgi:hypothetical protein
VSLKNPTLVECYFELVGKYSRINFTKSPVSGGRNVSDPRLMSQVGRVRAYQCVTATRAVEVPVLAFLRRRCNSENEVYETGAEGCHPK